ncbi:methyltransferase-domain-containing protein [Naematelia encephala]|uniref:Ribosomal RNA-processing protein 8 n=1 Tax=Naematelia encephala TaxID=71784 RepID=A0A1Y2B948_9TREE|nr:methyltransferase-domain-containing protein [Naematelia encephala]
MSLFASAFDTGLTSGPSYTTLTAPKSAKAQIKRKRPSYPETQDREDGRVRNVQKNFERVMKRVDGGEVKPKPRKEGTEVMGMARHGKKHNVKPATHNVEQNAIAKPGLGKSVLSPKETSYQSTSSASRERPAPAELPLPHDISKSLPKTSSAEEGLTNLQQGMKAKLEGARFRWINEQLYSTKSTEAVEMMKKDPKIFADYHMTHRALTSAWPQPPLPHLISLLTPLSAGTLVVDLGCGDAGLAKALVPQGKVVLSYDLVGDSGVPTDGQGTGGWVVETDFLEHVPLPGRPGGRSTAAAEEEEEAQPIKKSKKKGKAKASEASEVVDVVVCCLSLMGVNWVGGIYEACRILKQGGVFHIAEVTSRFISTEAFISKIESFGFELEHQEAPSSHFTLFRFKKSASTPHGPARGEAGWHARVKDGEQILRGCVYKKR